MFKVTPTLCRVKRGFLTLSARALTSIGGVRVITQVCYQLVTQTGVVSQSESVPPLTYTDNSVKHAVNGK